MGLIVHQVPVGGFDDNFSYLIYDEAEETGLMVDPTGDVNLIFAAVQDLHITLTGILLTHTHFDHTDGLPEVIKRTGSIPIYVHELGTPAVHEYGGIRPIVDHTELTVGDGLISVIHTPGHIDDAVCYFIAATDAASGKPKLISGDTLFVGGCGRTTETRVKDLYESLQELKQLPPETIIYPGHDYGDTHTATLAHELSTNQYLLAKDLNSFIRLRLG